MRGVEFRTGQRRRATGRRRPGPGTQPEPEGGDGERQDDRDGAGHDRPGDRRNATVTVSYQSEPLMGFLVPIEMRESYVRSGERITGHAVYGRFRLLKQ